MFSRLTSAISSGTQKVCNTITSIGSTIYNNIPTGRDVVNAVPGVTIVAARAGSAVLNAFKFIANILNIEDGAKNGLGIALAILMFLSAAIVNVYTRFFNLFRKDSQANADEIKQREKEAKAKEEKEGEFDLDRFYKDLEEKINIRIENIPHPAEAKKSETDKPTWTHPGLPASCTTRAAYIATQASAILYALGSGASGILSVNSLITLMKVITSDRIAYDDKCGSEHVSSGLSLIVAYIAMAFLIRGNVSSFAKYNLPAFREYFQKLFMIEEVDENGNKQKGWRTIDKLFYSQVAFSALLGSVGIFYGNILLLNYITENFLCHAFSTASIPVSVSKGISGVFAANNFFFQSLMTLGAQFNKQKSGQKAQVSEAKTYTEKAQELFKYLASLGKKEAKSKKAEEKKARSLAAEKEALLKKTDRRSSEIEMQTMKKQVQEIKEAKRAIVIPKSTGNGDIKEEDKKEEMYKQIVTQFENEYAKVESKGTDNPSTKAPDETQQLISDDERDDEKVDEEIKIPDKVTHSWLVQASVHGNSLNTAIATFSAVFTLPKTLFDATLNETGKTLIMIVATIAAQIGYSNQRVLDEEGCKRENDTRTKEKFIKTANAVLDKTYSAADDAKQAVELVNDMSRVYDAKAQAERALDTVNLTEKYINLLAKAEPSMKEIQNAATEIKKVAASARNDANAVIDKATKIINESENDDIKDKTRECKREWKEEEKRASPSIEQTRTKKASKQKNNNQTGRSWLSDRIQNYGTISKPKFVAPQKPQTPRTTRRGSVLFSASDSDAYKDSPEIRGQRGKVNSIPPLEGKHDEKKQPLQTQSSAAPKIFKHVRHIERIKLDTTDIKPLDLECIVRL